MDGELTGVEGEGNGQGIYAGDGAGQYIIAELYGRDDAEPIQFIRLGNSEFKAVIVDAIQESMADVQSGASSVQDDGALSQLHSQVNALITVNVVMLVAVFACAGSLIVRTLVKSFER